MRRSRVFQAILIAVVLVFAGARTYRYAQLLRQSPFVLWEFRAGGRFTVLERSAYRQTRQRFTCNTVVASARLCEMRVKGIEGLVRVLVDSHDRIAVVEFAPDSASPAMREEARRVAAEWSLIRAGESARPVSADTTTSVTRWQSEDGKWTAVMRYGGRESTPAVVTLADETAVAELSSSAPLASYVLALNGLIESRDVPNVTDVDAVMRTTMFGRATDPANETPAPRAPATPVPLCAPERSDPIVLATPRSLDGFTESMKSLLERAIPAVYPGSHLEMGDGMWLVSAGGVSERISFTDVSGVDSAGIATGVSFRGRSSVAGQRMEDGVPDRFCRAPGEVLFARPNGDGSLADAHLVDVDPEALASDVLTIRVAEPDGLGEPGHVRVRYASGYVAQGWSGTIEWETVIAENPPRATVRVPLLFGQQAAASEGPQEGHLVVTGRPSGGIEVSTIEKKHWGFTTRTVIVPVDSTGVLLGARILERLAATQPAP
jgi:hypothetical protein